MNEVSATATDTAERTIPDVFEEQVARRGDRVALRWAQGAMTWLELDGAANAVASALLAGGGDPDAPVAVLIGRGGSQLAAALGVLKVGRCYVPLDVAQPPRRLAEILDDAGTPLILTDRERASVAAGIAGPDRVSLAVDALVPTAVAPPRTIVPESPAYLLYTSGSTGGPKGVLHSHRNIVSDALAWAEVAALTPADRVACLQSFAVAASTPPLFGSLLTGVTVLPFDVREDGLAALATFLMAEDVTVLCTFPALFRRLLAGLDGGALARLRLVRLGGERLFPADIALARRHVPGAVLINAYGATEAHAIGGLAIDRDTPEGDALVPIGWPLPSVEVDLVDAAGREIGHDEPDAIGEIVVRSRHLALGYWRRPELSAAAFTEVPGAPGVRAYRTGDLGRRRADGCITHLGRADEQVKVRGFRVEPGEVEAALLRHPALREAVVIGWDATSPEGARLAAYVVAVPGVRAPDTRELARFVRERLPDYMIPTAILVLEQLPLLPGGKVDRAALPRPEPRARRPLKAMTWAGNPLQQQISEVWQAVLGLPRVGIRDDFFELGGTSLLAVEMIARVRDLVGSEIPVAAFVAAPTIASLAAALLRAAGKPAALLTTLRRGDPRQLPFFFIHGDFSGGGLYCHALFRAVEPGRTIHLLHPHAPDGPATIEAMAASYLQLVRAERPSGPYLIGGYCNGGVLAFEIARRLCALGERVPALIAIEARLRQPRPAALSGLERALRSVLGKSASPRLAHYDRALTRYAPGPYPGHMMLIRTARPIRGPGGPPTRSMAGDPTAGFGDFATAVDVRVVPGDHHSMLARHAPVLAAHLSALLRASDASA